MARDRLRFTNPQPPEPWTPPPLTWRDFAGVWRDANTGERVVGPIRLRLGVRRGWLMLAALTGWEWAMRRATYVRPEK